MKSFNTIEKKKNKLQQLIWLTIDDFKKVLELASEMDLAPNVVCASIIHSALNDKNFIVRASVRCSKCHKEYKHGEKCPLCGGMLE